MRHVYRFVIKLLSERWPAGWGLFIRNEGGNSICDGLSIRSSLKF